MIVSVLGELEVRSGQVPLYLPSAYKARLVLAQLCARAHRPVSVSELISHIWPERPPASARSNVQLYVHQLRIALGANAIGRSAHGYCLSPTVRIDALRFQGLVAAGVDQLSAGDADGACGTLREALAMWRGKGFAGFTDCKPLAEEAARLDHHRFMAVLHLAEAEISRGRQVTVIPQIRELIPHDPFHEGLRERLMLLLCLNGQRTDALETYRCFAHLLREELGIEPGERLQRAHRVILRGDLVSPLTPR